MVPRALQDAGYTAVGLGVLALQQVQTRRRELAETIERLPRLPGPIGQLVDLGRTRLCSALKP